MGDDQHEWSLSEPNLLVGVDLTERAIRYASIRTPNSFLYVADAESLPFRSEAFDIVYSWGVLHHSPDTSVAVREIFRVLRPGGVARVMIYSRYSIVAFVLLAVYGWRHRFSLRKTLRHRLESPGTQAFTVSETKSLFAEFCSVSITHELSPGDLLIGRAGQGHEGRLLRIARRFWLRRLIRRYGKSMGLFLLIEARKPM
jgi:SAM-dependent methyltransferase